MGDEGVLYLSNMFKNKCKLTHLWLNKNDINDQDVQNLCEALIDSSSPLQELNLSENKSITNQSVTPLCNIILELPALESLEIKECHLGERVINQLRDVVNLRERQKGKPRVVLII